MGKAPPFEETTRRFWARVDRRGPDDCWEWTGSRTTPMGGQSAGYGQLSAKALRSVPIKAHVMAYFLTHGEWAQPAVLHTCDNPPCCNPRHLYQGTHQQNMADRVARRPRVGAANPAARYADLVLPMRQRHADGESIAAIARSLNMSSGTAWRIIRGQTYSDVAFPSATTDGQ